MALRAIRSITGINDMGGGNVALGAFVSGIGASHFVCYMTLALRGSGNA